ncbi:MAG: hypothetical protein ACRC62_09975 [Microcoleus sp.]
MPKTHAHIATSWQLKAASEGRLGAIVLPLVPEPTKDANTWVWESDPVDLFWFEHEGVGDRLLSKLQYQLGDRIHLHAASLLRVLNDAGQELPPVPATISEYRLEVTNIEVVQLKNLTFQFLIESGTAPRPCVSYGEIRKEWDETYPTQRWYGDRWVIFMHLSKLSDGMGTISL